MKSVTVTLKDSVLRSQFSIEKVIKQKLSECVMCWVCRDVLIPAFSPIWPATGYQPQTILLHGPVRCSPWNSSYETFCRYSVYFGQCCLHMFTQLCGLKFAHLSLHSDRNPDIFTNCMLRWGLFSVSTRCNRQFANCLQYQPASFVSVVKLNSCVELAGLSCRCLPKCRGRNCSYWVSRYRNKEMFYT